MKKLRVWGWLISAFFKKHSKIILLGTTLGIISAIFIIWILPYIPRPNPTFKVGLIGQYHKNDLPSFVTTKIGQGLTGIVDDGTPVPALADHWDVQNDGHTYTFYLRDNLFWQDGTPVTADSLNYQFKDVETKVIDQKTVQFNLQNIYTPFPTLVSSPALKNGVIGTGEYKVRKVTEQGGFVESITLESPKKSYVVKFYPSLKLAATAFSLGEIDELNDIYKNPFENDVQWSNSVTVTSHRQYNQFVGLFLNNNDQFLSNKNFRQALAYATTKPTDDSRAYGPVSVTSWAYNEDLKPYSFDPQHAKELYDKAKEGFNNAVPSLKISTTQSFLPLAEEVKRDWEEILQVPVDIEVINSIPQDYQILLASQEIPSDPDQYSLWHSTQTQNFINFKSFRVDKLLEDARQEQDINKRGELYQDFQRFFVEECPIIFINYPQTYTVSRKSIVRPFITAILQFGRS